ncbi:hypothetical protein [Chlorobaculum tepidum]|jgi:hypothetical protein|uniref:hypothetical protein n=1 Tax=Chlorobaculum tepidum TaxID=1097 RepID=UPI0013E8DF55|nr:hypothetical protein [Chlorobaculum tepidum]
MTDTPLQDMIMGRNSSPESMQTLLKGNGKKVAGSREETYFTLLINIYSLNLFQVVITGSNPVFFLKIHFKTPPEKGESLWLFSAQTT